MHPNPVFRKTPDARSVAFLRARAFGTLLINGPEVPMGAHVPFLLSDDVTYADLHLVRSNPIARALGDGLPARLAVTGPDSYISPDWYETPDQVPTWNYVAVHLTGRLVPLPADGMHGLLEDQSAHFETQLKDKRPWTTAKMSEGVMERMMRSILPFRFEITDIDSTWKLGQNKPEAARLAAAGAVADADLGSETASLSALMQDPPA